MLARRSLLVVVAATVGLTACSSGDDSTEASAPPASSPTESTRPPGSTLPAQTTTDPIPATTQPPATIPVPVPEEGSVHDVISQREDLSNFNTAIEAWLVDSEGREGVLRNARGVTLFVPDNDGFTRDDLAVAVADPDAFTFFLSEHLKVGELRSDQLGEGVATAMGVTYPVGDGTIGDSTLVEVDIEATNGVIHIIDRPLAPIVAG